MRDYLRTAEMAGLREKKDLENRDNDKRPGSAWFLKQKPDGLSHVIIISGIEMIRSFPASNESFRKSENPADSSPASDQMTLGTKKD
jgi:hypothetical protein